MNNEQLNEKLELCIQRINKELKTQNIDLHKISSNFFESLQLKARLEQLEQFGDIYGFEECCKNLKEYFPSIYKMYKDRYSLYLPEEILQCAKQVVKNRSLFNKENDTLENEDDKKLKEKIEQECFNIIIQRESIELLHSQITRIFPEADFFEVQLCIDHIDRMFSNLYLPYKVIDQLNEYARNNNINTESMPYFALPSIDEIPILLPYDYEEAETQAIYDAVKKKSVFCVNFNISERLRADLEESFQEELENNLILMDGFEEIGYEYNDEYICIQIGRIKNKVYIEIKGKDIKAIYNKMVLKPVKHGHPYILEKIDEIRGLQDSKIRKLQVFFKDKRIFNEKFQYQFNSIH